jgi:ribosome-binding factor A
VPFKRADRVSEAIKREISVLILQELKDPEVVNVTVMDVETADDLRHARVYVSIMGDEQTNKSAMAGLERAKGFLRSRIAQSLGLRYATELAFRLDDTLDKAMRIQELLNEIKAKEAPHEPPEAGPGPEESRP